MALIFTALCSMITALLALTLFAPSGWAGNLLNKFIAAVKWLVAKVVSLFQKTPVPTAVQAKLQSAQALQELVNKNLPTILPVNPPSSNENQNK